MSAPLKSFWLMKQQKNNSIHIYDHPAHNACILFEQDARLVCQATGLALNSHFGRVKILNLPLRRMTFVMIKKLLDAHGFHSIYAGPAAGLTLEAADEDEESRSTDADGYHPSSHSWRSHSPPAAPDTYHASSHSQRGHSYPPIAVVEDDEDVVLLSSDLGQMALEDPLPRSSPPLPSDDDDVDLADADTTMIQILPRSSPPLPSDDDDVDLAEADATVLEPAALGSDIGMPYPLDTGEYDPASESSDRAFIASEDGSANDSAGSYMPSSDDDDDSTAGDIPAPAATNTRKRRKEVSSEADIEVVAVNGKPVQPPAKIARLA
ncbi:hypothetical protein C8F04DRAFT_1062298 [Mycena alexandri]|uniref:Uncharacterized protein n=1 Tax=Mycena alexandri TaxID=1745969 RepID=A0AAD6TIL6_9AGAR|nr:hypothetical protein C8F04DRAFT_1062298 [Mycena alexandri]